MQVLPRIYPDFDLQFTNYSTRPSKTQAEPLYMLRKMKFINQADANNIKKKNFSTSKKDDLFNLCFIRARNAIAIEVLKLQVAEEVLITYQLYHF
jgi:hypothetical protein